MEGFSSNAAEFLERTTVRELLNVGAGVIDQARRIAYQLYQAGRLAEAEVVCRGLIACDHRAPWSYSLHAAILRRLGRTSQALAQVQRGLALDPGHGKLRAMRDELAATLDRPPAAAASSPALAAPVQQTRAQRAPGRTDSDP